MRNVFLCAVFSLLLLHVLIPVVVEATTCSSYYQSGCFLLCDKGDECVCEIKSSSNYTACNQQCEKENITQCPTMKCIGNNCQQYCKQKSKCTMSCSGGSTCIQECLATTPSGCDHITCSSAECNQHCSNCTMECTSSVKKCTQQCTSGSCNLRCHAEKCQSQCSQAKCTFSAASVQTGYKHTLVSGISIQIIMYAVFNFN